MPVAVPLAIVGASVASAAISSSAAKSAAQTQATAANKATDTQLQMYGQTRQDLAPFRDIGTSAGSSLSKLLGLGDTGGTASQIPTIGDPNIGAWLKQNPDVVAYYNATPAAQTVDLNTFAADVAKQQANIRNPIPTYTAQDVADYRTPQDKALEALPGYQFTRDQGISSVNRQLGSMGLTGAQAKGISRFVTGLADSTYNSQVQNLQNATNTGENAAAQTGTIGQGYSGNISNTITGAGQAQASGTVGAANAINGAIGTGVNGLLTNRIVGMYGTPSGSSGSDPLAGLY